MSLPGALQNSNPKPYIRRLSFGNNQDDHLDFDMLGQQQSDADESGSSSSEADASKHGILTQCRICASKPAEVEPCC